MVMNLLTVLDDVNNIDDENRTALEILRQEKLDVVQTHLSGQTFDKSRSGSTYIMGLSL